MKYLWSSVHPADGTLRIVYLEAELNGKGATSRLAGEAPDRQVGIVWGHVCSRGSVSINVSSPSY